MSIRLSLVKTAHSLLSKAGRGGSLPGVLALKMEVH